MNYWDCGLELFKTAIKLELGGSSASARATWGANETLFSEIETVELGAGSDTLVFTGAEIGSLARVTAVSGAGLDTLDFTAVENPVHLWRDQMLGIGRDSLSLTLEGFERALGGKGGDLFIGGGAVTTFLGNGGDDTFQSSLHAETFIGGAGRDTADYAEAASGIDLRMNVASRTASPSVGVVIQGENQARDTLNAVEIVSGSSHRDVFHIEGWGMEIHAGGDNDRIYGGHRADILHGDDGDDVIYGYSGNWTYLGSKIQAAAGDKLYGGKGKDTLYGADGADFLSGGADDDIIYAGRGSDIMMGGAGADRLVGGGIGSYDTISYADAPGRIYADLRADIGYVNDGHGSRDTVSSIERVIGSNHADYLLGGKGYRGIDAALGAGNDVAYAYGVKSNLYGEAGNDYLSAWGGYMNGRHRLDGGAGDDVIVGVQWGYGTLIGGTGNDRIYGYGKGGIFGSTNDVINGGDGVDLIASGNGFGGDAIWGGAGADVFWFTGYTVGKHTIYDFNPLEDLLFINADWRAPIQRGGDVYIPTDNKAWDYGVTIKSVNLHDVDIHKGGLAMATTAWSDLVMSATETEPLYA